MDLSIYNVVKGPRITDKAQKLNAALGQLVLDVHIKANKSMIDEALKRLFNVEPIKIRIIVRKGKNRRHGKFKVAGSLSKKAIVTLPKGFSMDNMSVSDTASSDLSVQSNV